MCRRARADRREGYGHMSGGRLRMFFRGPVLQMLCFVSPVAPQRHWIHLHSQTHRIFESACRCGVRSVQNRFTSGLRSCLLGPIPREKGVSQKAEVPCENAPYLLAITPVLSVGKSSSHISIIEVHPTGWVYGIRRRATVIRGRRTPAQHKKAHKTTLSTLLLPLPTKDFIYIVITR